ncbi:flagellar hook assembly protein FlgD [Phenylobacterium sp.]|jgi:flagellar basal-body rod modification protein FlgD|uniref:flagellar hook assembly protein FlgD n=1 Tax=Phenylobacterium sp. TaxID=1871053 RepID=UPI003784E79C
MAVAGIGAQTDVTAGARTRLAENFDTFLTLLTTQLKNQDPLSPMDSNQFTQQMVQMTGVEQQLLTNDLLKQLVGNTNSGISTAVSLIGREVKAVSDKGVLQNGKASWTYDLDRDATEVKVEIVDANGKSVHSKTLSGADLKAGDHKFTWDGKDLSGQQLPDGGDYRILVSAKDSAADTVPTTIYVEGMVAGVEQTDGQTLITVNGAKVPWNYVTSVKLPEEAAEAETTPNPNNNPAG